MDGLWLVNQGPVNTTSHIDDVAVTGEATTNRAPEEVGSMPSQGLNPGQARTVDVSSYYVMDVAAKDSTASIGPEMPGDAPEQPASRRRLRIADAAGLDERRLTQ